MVATYKEIQDFIKQKHGISVKTCWIADVKEKCGLNPKIAHNRILADSRKNLCPPDKIGILRAALKELGMI